MLPEEWHLRLISGPHIYMQIQVNLYTCEHESTCVHVAVSRLKDVQILGPCHWAIKALKTVLKLEKIRH